MSVNLSIKGVPDEWAERLRMRAERNHRSLQGELMALIEQAAADEAAHRAATERADAGHKRRAFARQRGNEPIEKLAAEMRALYPEPVIDVPRAVDIVREMRDSR